MHNNNTLAAIVAAGMWANPTMTQDMSNAGANLDTIVAGIAASAHMQATAITCHPTTSDADAIVADLQEYFPGAVGLHDCYRAIEALQDQRDELLAALELAVQHYDEWASAYLPDDLDEARFPWLAPARAAIAKATTA